MDKEQIEINTKMQVLMEQLQKDISELKGVIHEMGGNFDGKFNMLIKLISEKEGKYFEKFATKEEVKNSIDKIKIALMPTNKLVFEILKWLAVIGAGILLGNKFL